MQWLRLRIVPPDRQNIAQILSDLKLPAYDEFKLLEYTKGRCSHDDYYITKVQGSKLHSISKTVSQGASVTLCLYPAFV